MDPWKSKKQNLLKLKMNIRKIVLVYFFFFKSFIQVAVRSQCMHQHTVKSSHVAAPNTMNFESCHLFLCVMVFQIWSTRVRIDLEVVSSKLWVKSLLLLHILTFFLTLASVQREPSCAMQTDGRTDGQGGKQT